VNWVNDVLNHIYCDFKIIAESFVADEAEIAVGSHVEGAGFAFGLPRIGNLEALAMPDLRLEVELVVFIAGGQMRLDRLDPTCWVPSMKAGV
jgi:hypothetical protein